MPPNSVGKEVREMIAMAGIGHEVISPHKTPSGLTVWAGVMERGSSAQEQFKHSQHFHLWM